jgi:hypothetical protein
MIGVALFHIDETMCGKQRLDLRLKTFGEGSVCGRVHVHEASTGMNQFAFKIQFRPSQSCQIETDLM